MLKSRYSQTDIFFFSQSRGDVCTDASAHRMRRKPPGNMASISQRVKCVGQWDWMDGNVNPKGLRP